MAKRNGNGSLGRKVKMSQPVAIAFDRYVTLVEGKVIKGPVVPKMEVMEKWIVSGGRDIEIGRDTETGLHVATLTAPSADGKVLYTGEGETMSLATMEAIHAFLKAQPKPDPEGRDLPLFRENGKGGVDDATAITPDLVQADEADTGTDEPMVDESTNGQVDSAHLDGWQFQFIVPPADGKSWKKNPPADPESDIPIVQWEDGVDANDYDRGWYLHPDYTYDQQAGDIRTAAGELVWSRETAAVAGPKA